MNQAPPAFTRLLLIWLTPEPFKETYLGDLEEEFHLVARARGYRNACWWYRSQLVLSILPMQQLRSRTNPIGKHCTILFVAIAALACTTPLKDASVPFYIIEHSLILLAAFATGYVCTFVFACKNFLVPTTIATTIVLFALYVRGEREEILWLLPFTVLAILAGLLTFRSVGGQHIPARSWLG